MSTDARGHHGNRSPFEKSIYNKGYLGFSYLQPSMLS